MTVNGNGRDTLTLMLQCRRSQATRETYRKNLVYFFRDMIGGPPTEETMEAFLKMPRSEALEMVLNYKAMLLDGRTAGHRGCQFSLPAHRPYRQ